MNNADLVGQTLGSRYRIDSLIGRGGMATVYKAFDLSLQRDVAVKIPDPVLIRNNMFADIFQQEMRSVAQMRHPHLVTVYDTGQFNGLAFLVMEYIPGGAMSDFVQPGYCFPADHVARVVRQIADGLDYAHARGLVHRDVKPNNVLIDADGTIKLTDFGIAKMVNSGGTTGLIMGTPAYMSPEHILGQPASPANDIYALGVVAYEMLTGVKPFDGSDISIRGGHLQLAPRPVREVNPAVTPAVEQAVMYALNKSPDQRYPRAGDFADALQYAVSPRRPALKPWMLPAAAALGVLLVLLLAAWGGVAWREGQTRQIATAAEDVFVEGRIDDAIAGYEALLARDPSHLGAANKLMMLYNLRYRYPEAEALARDTLERHPDSAEAHAWLAEALLGRLMYDEALGAAERAVERDPEHPIGYIMRSQVRGTQSVRFSNRALLDQAAADADRAIEQASQPAAHLAARWSGNDVRLFQALAYNARGDVYWNQYNIESNPDVYRRAVDQGEDMYNRAISLQPQIAQFRYNLGVFFLFQGRTEAEENQTQQAEVMFDDALQQFRDALDRDPDHLESQTGIGWVYLERKEYADAEDVFKSTQTDDPRVIFANADYGLNRVYRERESPDFDQALAAIERASDIVPADDGVIAEIGWTYLEDKQYDEAERQFNKALAMNPSSISAHVGLNWVYRYSDPADYEKAREILSSAQQIDAENTWVLNNLGQTLLDHSLSVSGESVQRTQLLEQSAAEFQRAREINPLLPNAAYGIGETYYFRGQYEDAARMYREVIRLDADHVDAIYSLARSLENLADSDAANKNIAQARLRYEEAALLMQQAAELAPDAASYKDDLERIQQRLADLK